MLELSRAQRLAQFPDCCLETPQRRDRHGYGRINLPYNGKRIAVSAHRVAYSLFVGPLPAGEPVRHCCGNPACCNPKHLVVVPPMPASCRKGVRS